MSWRAFLIGLVAVVAVALVDPYASFYKGYGWNTQSHFPVAAVFVLVVVSVGANVLVGLLRRRWALRRAELLLVWCMLIVGCVVPSNLMRFWFPVLSAPAYLSARADVQWRETALEAAPEGLLLGKDPRSGAVRHFFEGSPGGQARIPWRRWLPPVGRWGALLALFYLATFFMCAILRRQWVDRERLQFPLARVPLEFTRQSEGGVLPAVFGNRFFLVGLGGATALRLMRSMPLILGSGPAWNVTVPLGDMFQQTPLEPMALVNFSLNWMPIGLAYLVPADVSLSIWFFYLFGRVELQTAAWMGSTLHYGGSFSELMQWQRTGAYLALTAGALWLGRRHLASVVRAALGGGADDEDEPVGYRLSAWGFLLCASGAVGWFAWFGMRWWSAVLLLGLLFCTQFVHARLVSQSGLYRTAPLTGGPNLLHALGFGRVFAPTGATLAQMQYTVMVGGNNSMLGPAAIHAFRISEVFGKRRRLLLPALLVALAAAIAASTYTVLWQAYDGGALSYSNIWAAIDNPEGAFDVAHQMIKRPEQVSRLRSLPFGLGIGLTAAVMFLRARFYWWPVHPVGLVAFASYGLDRMWFSFFLGWLIKMALVKFAAGRQLRQGRFFFVGFILGDMFFAGTVSLISLLSGGAVPGAGVWI